MTVEPTRADGGPVRTALHATPPLRRPMVSGFARGGLMTGCTMSMSLGSSVGMPMISGVPAGIRCGSPSEGRPAGMLLTRSASRSGSGGLATGWVRRPTSRHPAGAAAGCRPCGLASERRSADRAPTSSPNRAAADRDDAVVPGAADPAHGPGQHGTPEAPGEPNAPTAPTTPKGTCDPEGTRDAEGAFDARCPGRRRPTQAPVRSGLHIRCPRELDPVGAVGALAGVGIGATPVRQVLAERSEPPSVDRPVARSGSSPAGTRTTGSHGNSTAGALTPSE